MSSQQSELPGQDIDFGALSSASAWSRPRRYATELADADLWMKVAPTCQQRSIHTETSWVTTADGIV
jgi:hypothetical protein